MIAKTLRFVIVLGQIGESEAHSCEFAKPFTIANYLESALVGVRFQLRIHKETSDLRTSSAFSLQTSHLHTLQA
jgi:hypothetical protein